MNTKAPQPTPDPNAARRFRVRAPLGMTTTDAAGHDHDHKPGAILTWAQLNMSERHVRTLLRVGDLDEVRDDVPAR